VKRRLCLFLCLFLSTIRFPQSEMSAQSRTPLKNPAVQSDIDLAGFGLSHFLLRDAVLTVSPQSGRVEYDKNLFYYTPSTSQREIFASRNYVNQHGGTAKTSDLIAAPSVASAATLDLVTDPDLKKTLNVTGSATVATMLINEDEEFVLRFPDGLTLTASSTLLLQGGKDHPVPAGGWGVFRGGAAGVVICLNIQTAEDYSTQTFDDIFMKPGANIGFPTVGVGNYFDVGRNPGSSFGNFVRHVQDVDFTILKNDLSGGISFDTSALTATRAFSWPDHPGMVATQGGVEDLTHKTVNGTEPGANATGFVMSGGSVTEKILNVRNNIVFESDDADEDNPPILNIGLGGTLGSAAYTNSSAYEPPLGNPGTNGFVLSSTIAGTRSWVASSTGTVTNFSAADLSPLFTTSESTTTTTPALSFTLSTAAANTFFGNGTGGTAAPTFMSASTARTALGLGTLATQSGTFSGTSSGTNTGDQTSVTGNAGTATALQTARNINGVAFDGTGNITVTAAGSTLSDTVPVTKGGTGATTQTAHGVLIGEGTSAVATTSAGLAGQHLASNGASADPTFQNNDSDSIKLYQALGSTITISKFPLERVTTTSPLVDGTARFEAVFIGSAQNITGVKWWQALNGVYTADNNNYVGLYSYSSGTMTLVAISSNDGNVWKATPNSISSAAFTTCTGGCPYAAVPGVYYIAALYNSSAQTTAPTLGAAVVLVNTLLDAADFTSSGKFSGTIASQNSLPDPQLISGASTTTAQMWFGLY
jgi:hypothetical protein